MYHLLYLYCVTMLWPSVAAEMKEAPSVLEAVAGLPTTILLPGMPLAIS